jgi:hypothetical protein
VEVNAGSSTRFFAWYMYAPAAAGAGAAGQRWYTGQGAFSAGYAFDPLHAVRNEVHVINAPRHSER